MVRTVWTACTGLPGLHQDRYLGTPTVGSYLRKQERQALRRRVVLSSRPPFPFLLAAPGFLVSAPLRLTYIVLRALLSCWDGCSQPYVAPVTVTLLAPGRHGHAPAPTHTETSKQGFSSPCSTTTVLLASCQSVPASVLCSVGTEPTTQVTDNRSVTLHGHRCQPS